MDSRFRSNLGRTLKILKILMREEATDHLEKVMKINFLGMEEAITEIVDLGIYRLNYQ